VFLHFAQCFLGAFIGMLYSSRIARQSAADDNARNEQRKSRFHVGFALNWMPDESDPPP
jgi:hypothetical protein